MQKIDFEKGKGLVPVIVQDYRSREVLMVAYMNKQAWERTKKTGKAHYYSRSRKGLWLKGEESGNFQEVVAVVLVQGELGAIGGFASRESAGDFHAGRWKWRISG